MTFNKFFNCETIAGFNSALESGTIEDPCIVFIEETKQIWTHGQFYSCPYTKEEIDNLFNSSGSTITKADVERVLTGNITSHTHSYLPLTGTAANASKVANSLTLKINSGTTEGTNQYIYNGSSAKSLDIKAGSNVTLTASSGALTISSTNTTYGLASSTSNGLMSKEDKVKLDGVEAGAQVNDVTSVAGRTGAVVLTKSDVGLGNVTNESKATMFTNASLTGTPTAPTASSSTNSTQIATTAFVQSLVNSKIAASDAMIYKGTIGSSGATITSLPDTTAKTGWTYKVLTAGTYAGQKCEVGDMIICLTDGSTSTAATWTVIQTNIDGAVTGPSSSVDSHVVTFNGSTGKIVKDSGFTIGKSVPSNAVFTDTHYTTNIYAGSGTAANASTTNGNTKVTIADNTTVRGSVTIKGTGATTVTSDASGVVTINSTNTTYGVASTTANGLMSSSDKSKLDGIASGANKTTVDSALSSTSTNPVQNKIIKAELDTKMDIEPIVLTNQDLDDVMTTGLYAAGGGNSVTNKPDGLDAFGLKVYKTASSIVVQELTAGNTQQLSKYTRQYRYISESDGNEWDEWKVSTSIFSSTPVANQVVVAADSRGILKTSGFTIAKSVPSDAKFTDTIYTLPTASSSVLGGVKIGSNITLSSGVISLTKDNVTSALGYTPPTSNTTYSAGTGLTLTGTSFSLSNSGVTAGSYGPTANVSGSNGTTINVPQITVDAMGRVTSVTNRVYTSVDNNTTYGIANNTTNGLIRPWYNHTAASTGPTAGSNATAVAVNGISTTAGRYYALEMDSNGRGFVNVPWTDNNTTYSVVGANGSTGLVKNGSSVTSASGYTACPIISGVPYYKDTNTTYTLSSFGITATAAELNYCDGVTSNIQTQLNAKAASSHTHSYLPLSGGTMTGNITYSSKGTCYIGPGDSDAASSVGGALGNLVISSWQGVSFTTSCTGMTYTGKTAVSINCRTGQVYAAGFTGPLAGNSSTSTKLATARTINGTSFDGSANITTANWGTARTLTIGSTGKSVNGSGNVSWSLSEIGAAAASHNHNSSYVSALGTSGNYLTWTKNGTTNNITVPYASNADTVDGYHQAAFSMGWTSSTKYRVDRWGGNQDKNWKKIVTYVNTGGGQYQACKVKGTIYFITGNHYQAQVVDIPFEAIMYAYSNVANSILNSSTLYLPSYCTWDLIRIVRYANNSWEVQVRQPSDWTNISLEYTVTNSGGSVSAGQFTNTSHSSTVANNYNTNVTRPTSDRSYYSDSAGYVSRDRGQNTVSTLTSLPITKSTIIANLSKATNISLASNMNVGESITVICTPSASFTQPIPTSGSFISMDGSSLSVTSGKKFEINIYCYNTNVYSISCKVAK